MDNRAHGPHLPVISLDDNEDMRSAHHVASDSDSEVYCDSVDQFGAEEVRLSSRSSLAFVSMTHAILREVFESEDSITQCPVSVKQ